MVGMSAKSYLSGNIVRKEVHVLPDDPGIIWQNIEACRTEADIYLILGPSPLVVMYFINPCKDLST